ncbi:AraC-like DNA-binding protein [Gracilibacillus halotolerans]|uniref:AraC-like DNA-binding protein n=1 Tax=Gracilibacillus halotolerans TaxID=74386 RepID=A0A841RKX0_9BACI|nr:helix-turn-helix domain-containing protein [Gracilibacillus halotolerans]MBB6512517.1 AraC-like DNA-binding protein [Gracilibacillus halotolerans]
MKRFSTRHYFKLIAFLVVLSTLPVIITGGLSYWQSSKAIVDYSNEEKMQNIYQIQTNIEQVLRYIDLSTTYFVRSPQTVDVLKTDMDAVSFSEFHNLRKDLNHLQTLETGIEDMILVSFDKNWLINNDGLSRLSGDTYATLNSLYLNLPGHSHWLLEDADKLEIPNATKKSCPSYINLVKKLPILTNKKDGLISVLIPTCELKKIMAESTDNEAFIVLDEHNQVVADSNMEYVSEDGYVPQKLFQSIDQQQEYGQFEFNIQDIDYKISFRKSKLNNWTYLSVVKISDLHKKSSSIGWITVLIVSFLLIISLCFAFISGNMLYQPIKKLRNAVAGSGGDTPSSTNEFEVIETHIEKLLNQNQQLEQRIQSQVNQLKQLFTIRLLQGKVSSSELPLKMKSFNYTTDWYSFIVLSVKVDAFYDNRFNENDRDLILFAINNLIEDLIPETERLTPVVINDTQTTLVLMNEESISTYTQQINEKAEYIQERIRDIFNLSVSIGISSRFTRLEDAEIAFKESKEALKYRLKMGETTTIFYDNLNRKNSNFAPYPTTITKNIFDAIKLGNISNAKDDIKKFFTYLTRHDIHHPQLEIMLSRFLYELFEVKEEIGVRVENFNTTENINDYQRFRSLQEMEEWIIHSIVEPLISGINEKDESKNKRISDRMISLIHKNFDEDLSLDSIAAELHYNPTYLSTLFQKETGYSFSEYLLQYRLKKAKEWLTTTDKSVKEIAELLQYNNSQNFIRSFRKIEGITPGKYRSNYKSKKA